MKRLLIVYNPRSSRYLEVKDQVLARAKELSGYIVGKYEIANTNIEDNIKQLSRVLEGDDLVLTAGGDATAIIAANAILESGKKVTLAVLPYGNFNDLSRTLRTKTFDDVFLSGATARNFYPLEIIVDGKFQQSCCATYLIRQFHYRTLTFWMHQHFSIRIFCFQFKYFLYTKTRMNMASTIP